MLGYSSGIVLVVETMQAVHSSLLSDLEALRREGAAECDSEA